MSRHHGSLNSRLRYYFDMGLLFTVDQLAELTDESPQYVRVIISRIRKKEYCGKDEPLDLIQDIGKDDKKKRWGLRGSKIYANLGKLKK